MNSSVLERPVDGWVTTSQTPTLGSAPATCAALMGSEWPLPKWALANQLWEATVRTRTLFQYEIFSCTSAQEQWRVSLGDIAVVFIMELPTPIIPFDLPRVTVGSLHAGTAFQEEPFLNTWNFYHPAPHSHPKQIAPESLRALSAADDLRAWLDITYDDLAKITGIGKTTFHHWKRTGADPRPATTYRLRSVHALVRALNMKMGAADAAAWLRTGSPSPLDLLISGKLDSAERLAQDVLFSKTSSSGSGFSGFAPYDPETDFEVRSTAPAEGVDQPPRPRRIRLTRP